MTELVLAAGEIGVGQHPTWQVAGLTFNSDTIISSLVAGVIVLAAGFYLRYRATRKVPSALQIAFEGVTDQVERQVEESLGIRTAPFVVPLAITLFFFILIANWLSILPQFFANYVVQPTADVNLTFAMAFFVIIMVHITGLRTKGVHYFKHFTEPYPVFLPLNLIEEIVKPFTLALRLFGNMLAGLVMVAILTLIFPAFLFWLPAAAWDLFELFIGALQALIFALLTILYFGFAAGPDEDAERAETAS